MNTNEILQALAAPFDPADIHWKPQAISGNRCLAVAYLDARAVMDRLDAVCGLNWSDSYDVLPCGSVVCRLTITVDGRDVVRTDVGSPSEQPDDGDKLKAAFSDSLKRCAVKLNIGRYIYRLPKQWVDYDAAKKQSKAPPPLPAWALPANRQPAAPATVTTEQAKELQRLLQANRSIDPAKFLERFQAKRLCQVQADRFAEALAMLGNPPQEIRRKAA